MTDSIKNLEWRYAVKKFDSDKLLPQEKVDRLKRAFNLTATSYGLQPITLLVIKNKVLPQQLVQHSFAPPHVEHASHVLVICIQDAIDSQYIYRYFDKMKKIRGTSDEILNPFKDALVDDFSKKDVAEIKKWSINQA